MAAGSPRTVSFSPEKMIELGEEMIKWIKENPDTVHLSEWYTIEKMYTYNEWKTFIQRDEFIPYYERALKLVGLSYIKKDSAVDSNLKQRWQRVYFKDLKEQEDQDADEEVERKIKSQSSIPLNDDKVEKENAEMSENARLRKRIAELEANQLDNKC